MTKATETSNNSTSAAASTRAQRIEASQIFVDGLPRAAAPQRHFSDPATASRLAAELAVRTAMLRRLGEPRAELPPRLSRYRLLRVRPVQHVLLRAWNYLSRASRVQSQLAAECIDLISAEIQRMNKHAE